MSDQLLDVPAYGLPPALCANSGGHVLVSGDVRCPRCGALYADLFDLEQLERARPAAGPDMIEHPPHYTSHPSGVECITVTEHMGFNLGNVVKYLWRAEEKGAPLDDLRKARWYLDREIARRERAA